MPEVSITPELAARVTNAMRHGFQPPAGLYHLAMDIKGDERVAALRASVVGSPDETLVETIEMKRRYLALCYDEWLEKVGA